MARHNKDLFSFKFIGEYFENLLEFLFSIGDTNLRFTGYISLLSSVEIFMINYVILFIPL